MIPANILIHNCRKQKGYTYDRLADKSGYNANSILNWEKGHYEPKYSALIDILETCGYTLVLTKMEDANE